MDKNKLIELSNKLRIYERNYESCLRYYVDMNNQADSLEGFIRKDNLLVLDSAVYANELLVQDKDTGTTKWVHADSLANYYRVVYVGSVGS